MVFHIDHEIVDVVRAHLRRGHLLPAANDLVHLVPFFFRRAAIMGVEARSKIGIHHKTDRFCDHKEGVPESTTVSYHVKIQAMCSPLFALDEKMDPNVKDAGR